MEIKEFINQTLDDIINGINEASLKAKEQGISIYSSRSPIDFDIAVTAESISDTTKKGGINKILVAGISKSEELKNSVVSRIKFSVNIDVDNRERTYPNAVTRGSIRNNHF